MFSTLIVDKRKSNEKYKERSHQGIRMPKCIDQLARYMIYGMDEALNNRKWLCVLRYGPMSVGNTNSILFI
jgi:hypothetical protein